MTHQHVRTLTQRLVASIGHESAQNEIRWMKQAIPPGKDVSGRLEQMLSRRVSDEPLQYILGTQPFGPYELRVRAPVLIPRPETEEWTLRLHKLIKPTVTKRLASGDNFRILDLCTGSGCIPLLLLGLLPKQTRALAVDISSEALALAKENAGVCGISLDRLTLLEANIRDTSFTQTALSHGPFHVFTANPPYIAPAEYVTLPRSVRDFEDARALVSVMNATANDDPRGISFYDRIAELISIKGILAPESLVALEIGSNQGEDVAEIMRTKGGLQDVKVWKDAWGKDRVVLGRSA